MVRKRHSCMSTRPSPSPIWVTQLTLLLVYPENDDNLVAADSDELLNTSNTPSGQLGKENHSLGAVVLEELDVSTHLSNLLHLAHDHLVNVWELLLVVTHAGLMT